MLADPEGPAFLPPAFDVVASLWLDEDKLVDAMRTGRGIGWHEHHDRLFSGTEAFFRSGCRAHLTTDWIPSLGGVETKMNAGARVADVGCGHRASTIIMARAYPESTVVGYDYHDHSIEIARERAGRGYIRSGPVRGGHCKGLCGGRLRPDLLHGLSARHGRSPRCS